MAKAINAAGPATRAALPVRTKIPAPIIAPMPIIDTSKSPRSRLNSMRTGAPVGLSAAATSLAIGSTAQEGV